MQIIYKYELTNGMGTIPLPQGAICIHAAEQHTGRISLWFKVNPHLPFDQPRKFAAAPTGGGFNDEDIYLHTVVFKTTDVWHIIEMVEPLAPITAEAL